MKKNWEGKTVLIAEDEEVNYYLLEETFYGIKRAQLAIEGAVKDNISQLMKDTAPIPSFRMDTS